MTAQPQTSLGGKSVGWIEADTTSRALTIATQHLADAINDHVVTLATANGSTTSPSTRYIHYNNVTAKAVGLPKSDAKVIAALPVEDRALLALIRHGMAACVPQWAAQVAAEGGPKSHNKILHLAKQWATAEVKRLQACKVEEIITRAESLLALEEEVNHDQS